MNKTKEIIITVLSIIVVIVGCMVWYNYETSKISSAPIQGSKVNNTTGNEDDNNNEEKNKNQYEKLFTLENYPRVDASLAIHPLVDSIASDFLGIPAEKLNFEYTKTRTSDVYQNLVDGKADVIFAAEPSSKDYDYAKSKGVELDVMPATSSAFVFIVNKDNPVDSLTIDQIVKIYKGDITNWKEVGGKDEEIIPYQRPNGSGSQTAMISLVMKDENLMTAPSMKIQAEMGGLVDAIAEYDNAEAAIGYSYFYYINTMYKRDTIKMIKVNGIEPTIETIKNGEYPIYTNGYIVTLKGKENNEVKKWIENVMSERGSKIIEDAGYVPVN